MCRGIDSESDNSKEGSIPRISATSDRLMWEDIRGIDPSLELSDSDQICIRWWAFFLRWRFCNAMNFINTRESRVPTVWMVYLSNEASGSRSCHSGVPFKVLFKSGRDHRTSNSTHDLRLNRRSEYAFLYVVNDRLTVQMFSATHLMHTNILATERRYVFTLPCRAIQSVLPPISQKYDLFLGFWLAH